MAEKWKVPFPDIKQQFNQGFVKKLMPKIEEMIQESDFTLGPRLKKFEEDFSAYTGIKYVLGVDSGTAALQLALESVGITDGEVITVPNTFYATVNAIVAAGAKPVFVDVGDDYNMNPELIEKATTPRTRAIMPVHLTGRPAEMKSILEIAQKHQLYVIEDAAQATGARAYGTHVGNFGIAAGFSFHPLKILNAIGDAGVVATNDECIFRIAEQLRNQGLSGRDTWQRYGYNYRKDPVQALALSIQLPEVDDDIEKRIANARFYDERLRDIEQIAIPRREINLKEVYHLYIIQADNRDMLLQYLLGKGVEAKIHYPTPLHLQPATMGLGYKKGDFPVAEKQAERILTLPMHQHLEMWQREYVVNAIREFYKK